MDTIEIVRDRLLNGWSSEEDDFEYGEGFDEIIFPSQDNSIDIPDKIPAEPSITNTMVTIKVENNDQLLPWLSS